MPPPRSSEPAPARGLLASGLAIGACLAGIGALGDLRAHLVAFTLLFGGACVAYGGAVWLVARYPAATGRWLGPALVLGLGFRVILLATSPTLSDDLYRYVWEGRVLAAGQSPYRYAPDSPVLRPLRDDAIWARVNNLDVPSPYPPVAQLGGWLGQALTPRSPLGVKLVATAGDLAVLGALLALLAATGRPAAGALVYAWHPLVLLEFSHSGHNDSLMLAPLVLGLALVARGRRWAPALCFAVAALAKVTPLLLFPLLPRRIGIGPTLLCGGLLVLLWIPFLILGHGATGSLLTYLGGWADNDSLHALLRELVGGGGAQAVSSLLLVAGVGVVALHPALSGRPLWWQAYVVLALAIVLASTVHAWYATWLIPFLAVQLRHPGARRGGPLGQVGPLPPAGTAWLLFSGLVVLPYLTYDTHEWRLWISFAEYVPLYAVLALPPLWRRAPAAWRGPRAAVWGAPPGD
jgi:hypothetical protein